MYKVYNLYNQYQTDLSIIDQKVIESGIGDKWQDEIKHPIKEDWYINFVDRESFLAQFMSLEWLTTDIISDLPSDFYWHFDLPIRVVVNKSSLTKHIVSQDSLGQLMNYVLSDEIIKEHIVDNDSWTEMYIYFSEIYPKHRAILESYPETIKIETR